MIRRAVICAHVWFGGVSAGADATVAIVAFRRMMKPQNFEVFLSFPKWSVRTSTP